MSRSENTFHWADYVVFGSSLALSVGVGVFYAIKDRNKTNTEEMFLGGRSMSVIPVALSLLASFQSAIAIIGIPAETYIFDTMYLWGGAASIPMAVMATLIFVPIFYNLGVTSSYEYLSLRFSRGIRTLTSIIFTLQMLMYMAVVLYAPALGLSAVTGLDLWGVVIIVGVVCIFYTTIGGMRAVVWADSIQMVVILVGLFAVLIQGLIETGGMENAWRIANERGRVRILEFSGDPTVRHSIWSLVLGGSFTLLAVYGTNQAQVQRACALPTLRKAQLAYWLNVPGLIISVALYVLVGVVMFAFYSDCDPTLSKRIDSMDQTVPLFVMDTLGRYPGLPGLFVACIFAGALSTISSGLNAMAAVMLQDVVCLYLFPNMKEGTASKVAKGLAVGFGALCLGMTYVASLLGNVLQTAISLFGIIGGPVLGVFTLGMIFPWANKYGAFAGLLGSLTLTMWVGISAQVYSPPVKPAPAMLSIAGCESNITIPVLNTTGYEWNTTLSVLNSTIQETTTLEPDLLTQFYGLSYQYYSLFAVISCCVIGLLVSAVTGFTKPSSLNPDLICPLFDTFLPCLPENVLKTLRCGVHEKGKYEMNGKMKGVELDLEVPPPKEKEKF